MKAIFSHKFLVLLVIISMAAGLTACGYDSGETLPEGNQAGTNSIFGPDEDDSRRFHSTTVTLGGGGKLSLPLRDIHSIAIRGGDRVNAIWINGYKFGDNGGSDSDTLTLAEDEFINRIEVRHGEAIDRLDVWTNLGNHIGKGGDGGRYKIIDGEILAIGAKANDQYDKDYPLRLVQLKIMGIGLSTSEGFADEEGGNWFPLEKIKYIAINGDKSVDAIWINENKHGGNGGVLLGALTLAEGEYINRIEVRYGNRIDNLQVYTNLGNHIGGGGDGGSLAIREGVISEIGGWSGEKLDDIVVKGKFMPSFEEINSKPIMELVDSTLQFEDDYKRIEFFKNGFPLHFHSCTNWRTQHCQDMLRLPDAGNKQYYMGTYSQNCTDDEGGMVFVGELEKNHSSGNVIWMDELNNRHLAGGYNHPGDLRRIGNIVVIAGQNWLPEKTIPFFCDQVDRGQGSYQNVLFYDVSDPAKPQYIGKLNSCWSGLENLEIIGEIDTLSAAKSGDYYYLSFADHHNDTKGLKCRSKVFYPHAGWELIEEGWDYGPSPVTYSSGKRVYVGGAKASLDTDKYRFQFDELTFLPNKNGDLTEYTTEARRNLVKYVAIPGNSIPINEDGNIGSTFSFNSLDGGTSSIVILDVEGDWDSPPIKIQELESR